ncbi:restriction endonuclease subunit S [Niallia taxi]|uniref:restriction endonuclease subunit S n=1 Tax=Niallia taxi TaxID=2499688 RepID=UPI00300980F4
MEFKNVTLGQISVGGKGNYGIAAAAVDYDETLPTYLRITDISDEGYIITDSLKSVNESNSEKYKLQINDIVFARTGNSTGKSYFYDGEDGEFIYAGFLIKFSLDPNKVNPKYIRFYTLSEEYKGWVKGFSTGSTRGNINAQSYANMQIRLPKREYQDFVVDILSNLENKNKINNKIINNLEQLSRTLFKHWFIDFEFPNEEGQPYKSNDGEMVESELGAIPKGWSVDSLSSIADIVMGQSPKSDTYNNENIGLPLLNGAADFKKCNLSPNKYTSDAKKIGKKGDFVFGVRATIGLVTELDDTYAIGRGAGIAKSLIKEGKEYLYEVLNKAFNEFQYTASGSVYLNISKNDLRDYKICIPSNNVIKRYHLALRAIMIQKENLIQENKNLQQLRDTLLPKILSGEIDIPDGLEV